jgi:preprotein translocase subunit SecE
MARPTSPRGLLRQPNPAARQRFSPFRFFAEVWAELRKAEWPTREEAIRLTGMVITIAAVVAAILGVIDIGFNNLGRVFLGEAG